MRAIDDNETGVSVGRGSAANATLTVYSLKVAVQAVLLGAVPAVGEAGAWWSWLAEEGRPGGGQVCDQTQDKHECIHEPKPTGTPPCARQQAGFRASGPGTYACSSAGSTSTSASMNTPAPSSGGVGVVRVRVLPVDSRRGLAEHAGLPPPPPRLYGCRFSMRRVFLMRPALMRRSSGEDVL